MRDGIYEKVKAVDGVATSCNVVNLNVAPYNYNGTHLLTQEPSGADT